MHKMADSDAVFMFCKRATTIDNRPVKTNRIALPYLKGKKEDAFSSSISPELVQLALKRKTTDLFLQSKQSGIGLVKNVCQIWI